MDKNMTTVVKTGKTVNEAINEALKMLNADLEDVDIEILKQAKSGFLGFGSSDAMVKVSLKQNSFNDLLKDENKSEVKKEEIVEPIEVDPIEEEFKEEVIIEEKNEDTNSQMSNEDELEEIHIDDESKIEIEDSNTNIESVTELNSDNEQYQEDDSKIEEYDEEFIVEERTIEKLNDDEVEEFVANWIDQLLQKMHIEARIEISVKEDNIYVEIVDITDVDTGIVIGRRAETLDAIQYICGIATNRKSKTHFRVYVDVAGYRSRRRYSIEKMARRFAYRVLESHRPIRLDPMNAYERRIVHTAIQNMEGVKTLSEGREPYRRVVIHCEED